MSKKLQRIRAAVDYALREFEISGEKALTYTWNTQRMSGDVTYNEVSGFTITKESTVTYRLSLLHKPSVVFIVDVHGNILEEWGDDSNEYCGDSTLNTANAERLSVVKDQKTPLDGRLELNSRKLYNKNKLDVLVLRGYLVKVKIPNPNLTQPEGEINGFELTDKGKRKLEETMLTTPKPNTF